MDYQRTTLAMIALTISGLLSACCCESDDLESIAEGVEEAVEEGDEESDEGTDEGADKGGSATGADEGGSATGEGRFKVRYSDPGGKKLNKYHKILKEDGVIDEIVEAVNAAIALPVDVTIKVQSGDGPLYDPQERAIYYNHEFLDEVDGLIGQHLEDMSAEDRKTFLIDVTAFVLLHEIAHALIDVLKLPVVGKEEDAADGLATIFVTELYEEGAEMALTNAELFDIEAANAGDFEEEDFWDEHSLNAQRFASIVCWVYGSDPDKHDSFLKEEIIPEETAERCPEEYAQQRKSWLQLLKPHTRPGALDL